MKHRDERFCAWHLFSHYPQAIRLPEGFSKPLEDNNGMTLTSSTATSLVSDCDTVIDVNVQ
ncbi:hypothetical protein H8S17_04640 [Roseburia sp. BX1005]|uniref:Uncharacterized protein n=1 Tax=Roseburia zhanii TaxID=2763064 RepID=A0A923LMN1_9FIRM|nr:hypothetical protein [Roseburia zhanii]MBC5713508.1 hypothetical protein [Roseburia zhanii]